jgi:transposase
VLSAADHGASRVANAVFVPARYSPQSCTGSAVKVTYRETRKAKEDHLRTLVVVDSNGRKTSGKTDAGHEAALLWMRRTCIDADLLVGIEDVRHISSRLERYLMDYGVTCVRVPTKLMARVRSSARTEGESDPIDALAVAQAVLRVPNLPRAAHDEASRVCKLLVSRRDDLVKTRTGLILRVQWRVHELAPEFPLGLAYLDAPPDCVAAVVASAIEPAGAVWFLKFTVQFSSETST